MAMTDHGVLYGATEFYKECKKEDINPIIGCEIYVAPQGRLKKEPGTPINHLTLLAYETEGYENLIRLVTKAHLEGFYYKPRVDHGLLKEFHKGLIALSGCIVSEIGEAVIAGNEEKGLELIKKYQEIFGKENFFLEVMDHPEMQEQVILRQKYKEFGKILAIPVVATNDCHYTNKEDRDAHDILLCIQTNRQVQEKNRMRYDGNYSMRSPEEMKAAFQDHPEAIANTLEIARRCKIEIPFKQNLIPAFQTPEKKKPEMFLRELCEEGLKQRYGHETSPELHERLGYELSVIHKAGFDTYFLIVSDFIRYAREKGIIVGPGRGSAAGSLVSYCLGITNVDPLEYGLLFERFLNPERVSMPDIDIDFDDERRDEVIQYVSNKYGRENVAQIITFGTMAARAALRDVARAMGFPYVEADRIAKLIPPPVQGRHIPLKTSIKTDPELKKLYAEDERVRMLLDNAIKLEGTVRQASTHACAVVISPEPLIKFTPLQYAPGDDKNIITQFSMKPIEELGLLKMDFLGLRNLTILKKSIILIEKLHGTTIDLSKIPLDDSKTFELLSSGETTGVFQLESSGMKHYLKELKPTKIQDIIAMVSLYRPGPMPWIPMYIRGKHEAQKVQYLHPSFEPILNETYGVAVYQEQILEIAKTFAGFTLGEADILRKAVGKKDPVLLEEQREKFIEGSKKNGHSRKFAEAVFEKVIEPFAAYGFNKSHATCYAFIAYQTAYLKANYPAEFMAALLTCDSDNIDRVILDVQECQAMNIEVLPPSVHESDVSFTVVGDRSIRFGLKAIKGLGQSTAIAIIEARGKGDQFKDITDFAKRLPAQFINKKMLEALAYCGAFDNLGERKALAASTEEIIKFNRQSQEVSANGQIDLFGTLVGSDFSLPELQLRKVTPATRFENLASEKAFLGLYVSGHPLQGLEKYLAKKIHPIRGLNADLIGKRVKVGGLLTKVKKILTKSGVYMAYIEVEDLTGKLEIVIFPKIYQSFANTLIDGQILFFEGKLSKRGDDLQFIAESIQQVSLDSLYENAEKEREDGTFIIDLPSGCNDETMKLLKELLLRHRGPGQVVLSIPSGRFSKKIKLPFSVEVTEDLKRDLAKLFAEKTNFL